MKTIVLVFILAFAKVRADLAASCNMVGFYKELGCTPSAQKRDGCPQAFKCPDLHPDKNMCYYRGVAYKDGAKLPTNVTKNRCSFACFCRFENSQPKFECAAVDCADIIDADSQDCIKTTSLDSCCSTGQVCGKDAISKLSTCEADGKMYREGESFQPKGTIKNCVCAPKWDAERSLEDSNYCVDIDCGLEVHYQADIMNKCAPVFASNARTCPISFYCPTSQLDIIKNTSIRDESATCTIGNQTLRMDEEVLVEEGSLRCTCDTPPYVSCVKAT